MNGPGARTLLVVDDDPRIRGVLTQSLDSLGYHTIEAANGREALELSHRADIDGVIADINMPELDGLTLLHCLKSQRPSLPVVIITAYASSDNKAEAVDAGADAFLMKPFRLAKMEETLGRIFALPGDPSIGARRTIRDILIVEDDIEFRILMTELVQAMGYQADAVADAESALRRVNRHRPDVVIVDYKLPGMTGEALLRALKSTHPDLPVVLISGFAPSLTGREFADGAADAFLMKPFRIDRIGEILRTFEQMPPPSSGA